MNSGPQHAYRVRCREGRLRPDPAQQDALAELQSLHDALAAYRPKPNWLERLRLGRRAVPGPVPRGLYIHGPPGRGKSMLMELFFESAPIGRKRRVHVHSFMQEVQRQLHRWREEGGGRQREEPLPRLARQIAAESRLLCFDEFQIEAVADAMILRRLFESLLACGVVVVATTNTSPDELYKDGLQREQFLPFIELLKERLKIVGLHGATDYRREQLRAVGVYHAPAGPAADATLDQAFRALTGGEAAMPDALLVNGRRLHVAAQAHGVARFSFDELCGAPLGAADYLEIACRYQTVILAGIPSMGPDRRDEAKRFSILIESLYEQRAKLVCSAAAAPEALYPEGDGSEIFRRVVSRLHEMQSEDYIAAPHRPENASLAGQLRRHLR